MSYIVGVEQMGSAVPEREAKILAKDLLGRLSLTLEVPRTRITRELPLIVQRVEKRACLESTKSVSTLAWPPVP